MKNLKEKIIEKTLFYIGMVGFAGFLYTSKLALDSMINYKPESQKTAFKNVLNVSSHASKKIAADMDYDGKMDVLEREDSRGHFLFYKKGYGPSQSTGIEVKTVNEKFFEDYDIAHFQRMAESYYGTTNRVKLENNK